MQLSQYEFERFSTKDGFNNSLNHFQAVTDLLGEFQDQYNLADLLNELISDKEIEQNQLAPIVYALLVDKFGYKCQSVNISETITDFTKFKKEIISWDAVDIVLAYSHPQLGYTLINPKNEKHWNSLQNLTKNELITVFAGGFADDISESLALKAIKSIISLLDSGSAGSTTPLKKGAYKFEPLEDEDEEIEEALEEEDDVEQEVPAVSAAPSKGKKRMTPFYSIPVTNELFHNGNVEAWKKIIHSYQAKNPGLDVYIFYDGERIHDINTLFKWGKVKHGSAILIAVAGDEIRDVAKLQRYLRQGASPKFEDFLRFPVNVVLNLF